MKQTPTPFLIAVALVALAVGSRWLFHEIAFIPNVELVTVASIIAAAYLGRWYAFGVPLATMLLSDMLIGNSSIYLFTWSAFLAAGLCGCALRRMRSRNRVAGGTLLGLGFALFFFLWTNFGVWMQGWYPPTFAGLMESYAMGLPFFRTHLVSTLLFVPSGIAIAEWIRLRVTLRRMRAVITTR